MSALAEALDRPIAFHACLARMTGSVNAGLMLSQAIFWSRRSSTKDGWFYKIAEEWEDETTMKRDAQEAARKRLKQFTFWQEELRGLPAKLYFRVDMDELETRLGQEPKLESSKSRNSVRSKAEPSNLSEITAETTTEIPPNPQRGDSAKADADVEKSTGNKAKATLEELAEYVQSLGLPASDAEYMFDHWTANGWKVGKNSMKDWKATVRNWKRGKYLPSQQAEKRYGHSRPVEKPDTRNYVTIDNGPVLGLFKKGDRE